MSDPKTEGKITAIVQRIAVSLDPEIEIFNIKLSSSSGIWKESFGTEAQLRAFLRGVGVASSLGGQEFIYPVVSPKASRRYVLQEELEAEERDRLIDEMLDKILPCPNPNIMDESDFEALDSKRQAHAKQAGWYVMPIIELRRLATRK